MEHNGFSAGIHFTPYGKIPKYCKTPTFGYFHGGKKICSQNQSAEKILKKNFV